MPRFNGKRELFFLSRSELVRGITSSVAVEAAEDPLDVRSHRMPGYSEPRRDLRVRPALREKYRNLCLAKRESEACAESVLRRQRRPRKYRDDTDRTGCRRRDAPAVQRDFRRLATFDCRRAELEQRALQIVGGMSTTEQLRRHGVTVKYAAAGVTENYTIS